MQEDQYDIPEFIVEFINSLLLLSNVQSKKQNYQQFNFCLFLVDSDNKGNLEHRIIGKADSDLDAEVILSLIWKNGEILESKINQNSVQPISYPKPKQIKDGYFNDFNAQLDSVKQDLDYIYKKFGYSYLFILYKDDVIKFIYKMKQEIAELHSNNIFTVIEHARASLMGISQEEMEEMMEEMEGDEYDDNMEMTNSSEDDFIKKIKNSKDDILKRDDDEFNNH